MMKIKPLKLTITLIGILTSCGGGTDPEPPLVDTSSSDWDSMVWEQDDWG